MTHRSRLVTTAACLCHLLLGLALLTSEARGQTARGSRRPADGAQSSGKQESPTGAQSPQTSSFHVVGPEQPGEEVTMEAKQQEKIGDLYRLKGDVAISFRHFTLRADEITYNNATGEITATGHIVFDGGPHDEHLEADHATYNAHTDRGKFYDVKGTTGARFRGRQVVLTSSNPFFFSGALVEKDGPNHFVVHHGVVTSCEMPNPKWTFNAEKVVVDVGQEAKIYHSTFRLGGIPVFYFPYAQHPVDKLGRQSGFLIPTIGQSSRKGTILGESVYWAINRSMDATAGAEYFSARGWAQHGDFRARPSEDSYVNANYFGVLDRGFGSARVDQGGEEVRITSEARLSGGFRGVADIDYLSSFVFRLAFAESFNLAVNSEVRSTTFVSKSYDGYFFNAAGSRYQNFQSTNRGDLITILHAPSLDLGGVERRLGPTPFFWSYDVGVQGVSRREPDFVTSDLVGRFDIHPRIAMPMVFSGWSIRPEVAVRDTYYGERRAITGSGLGVPVRDPVNRRALETSIEIRPPALSRIFEKPIAGYTLKHTIEPRFTYRNVTGVDNFPAIIRFDATDILSDTNEIEYGVVNRLYAKGEAGTECANPAPDEQLQVTPGQVPGTPGVQRPGTSPLAKPAQTGCEPRTPSAREIVSWEIGQKYFFDPTFGHALVTGQRNVFTTTADFSGIAFLTEPRRFSPIISRLRVNTTRRTDVQWNLDYDTKKGRLLASTTLVEHHIGDVFVAGSHAYVRVPGEIFVSTPLPGPSEFNQLRWLIGYGHPNKRGVSAAANVGFDIGSGFLQYSAFQSSYNWDCCGVSFEYRRFALGAVRNENQFRFALSLSNVGTFGTLRRQERLF